MFILSGIFSFTFWDTRYLGKLILGTFAYLLKGIWDVCLFTFMDMGYWGPLYTIIYTQSLCHLVSTKTRYTIQLCVFIFHCHLGKPFGAPSWQFLTCFSFSVEQPAILVVQEFPSHRPLYTHWRLTLWIPMLMLRDVSSSLCLYCVILDTYADFWIKWDIFCMPIQMNCLRYEEAVVCRSVDKGNFW